jgi:hypothetical protein
MEEPLKNFIDFFAVRGRKDMEESIEIAEAIKKDLLEKLPRIIKHFDEFEEASVVHLVERYAQERHRFTKSAKYYTEQAEKIQFEYRPEAGECLKYILQKKFFNAQCLWRAGKITLPGMDTTYDFKRWTEDLYNCPFIEPISQREVDILINYLNEHPHEAAIDTTYYDWQNYAYLKLCYFEEEEKEPEEFYKDYVLAVLQETGTPPWYHYYDTFMGTGGLIGLPDVKFPKEIYYSRLWNANKKKEEAEQLKKEGKTPPVKTPQRDRKLWLGTDQDADESIAEMVEAFEPRELQKLYQCYCTVEKEEAKYAADAAEEDEDMDEDMSVKGRDEDEDDRDVWLREEVESVLYYIKSAREAVPIEAHSDWRVALIEAYRKYKIRKIIEAIPAAYNDYLMRLETGIGFEKPEDAGLAQYMLDMKQHILEGRKLAGEPPDFNY